MFRELIRHDSFLNLFLNGQYMKLGVELGALDRFKEMQKCRNYAEMI